MANEILLESGTNEVEIFEYIVGDQSYGINVLKIRQIIKYEPSLVTSAPGTKSILKGTVVFNKLSIPVLNMSAFLSKDEPEVQTKRVIIITEFNQQSCGFLCDKVNKIHRISWEGIQSVSLSPEQDMDMVVGICHIDNKQIYLLDYENLLSETIGTSKMDWGVSGKISKEDGIKRENVKLFFSDDSNLVRVKMKQTLDTAGYSDVKIFDNGSTLYEAFSKEYEDDKVNGVSSDKVCVIVTDIEMPQMDGLTLCKKLKALNKNIPVIVISSLINDQIIEKCKSVDANNYLSKKEINKVIGLLDATAHIEHH